MGSFAVIGDVHGDIGRLRRMLRRLEDFRGCVILVGDYVDIGRDSAEVIELLTTLSERDPERYKFLCGNHELELLHYLDRGDFSRYCAGGGLATLASYLPVVAGDVHTAFVRALPARHLGFLRKLSLCWESEACLVSHAGFDPQRPLARDIDALTSPAGARIFTAKRYPRDLVVCGHYVQTRGPFVGERLICLDTGCGVLERGELTAAILPERRFLTA